MKIKKVNIGNKQVMPFTIPSGIVTTEVSCLERLAREIPELGVLTTKSIGPSQRAGNREPILAQYIPGGFINAVGLINPGAEEFAQRLSSINFPEDKFLLASIFGKDIEEFVYVAETLKYYVDGFELNLSCPHARGYGMQLGQDASVVQEITKAVVSQTKKPVFVKLTPNASNIGEIAKSAVSAGAYGIAAINTVGPGYYSVNGYPVLTNIVGGLSGRGITPLGIKCVRDIRQAIGKDVPIIGMGGIRNASDVEAYTSVGANFFGIGSALAGMTEREIKNYFAALVGDLDSDDWTNNAESSLKKVNMSYRRMKIEERIDSACDFKIFRTDESAVVLPGQFVFIWLPGIGEKPFSVMDDNPLAFGILERGEFTRKINSLQGGDYVYIRGPYGKGIDIDFNEDVVLVGGGCGIAGLNLLAKKASPQQRLDNRRLVVLLGAKDKEHIPYLEHFQKYGEVFVATEDGSAGFKGMVTDLFYNARLRRNSYFFNCGSSAMIDAIFPLELRISQPELVYSSQDFMTRCGIGICGSCADKIGRRACLEGPFLTSYN